MNIIFKKYGVSLVLWGAVSITWSLLYQAGDLPYDDNVAVILMAFLLSVLVTSGLIFLFFRKMTLLKKHLISIIVFLITSSPISLFWVMTNYEFIFGKHLAV